MKLVELKPKFKPGTSDSPILRIQSTTRRTNSLGWAKSDCHKCQALKAKCDRRRPRCDACTALGIICDGYTQKLKWQGQGQQPISEAASRSPTGVVKSQKSLGGETQYAFVQEYGRRKRKCKKMPYDGSRLDASRSAKRMNVFPVLYNNQPDYFRFPSSILEQLAFFAWRFSPVTLTYSIKANPWHACLAQLNQAPCLLSAVRALSIRHRSHLEETPESLSVLELKDQALSCFAQSVALVSPAVGISTSLILFALDYTESAYGNWTVYLKGVYRMIQAAGCIDLGNSDVYLKVQLAQLIWYDTIIAMVSRRSPIFPRDCIENVLSMNSRLQWSLFAISGVPDAAFLDVYDIAEAAAHASSLSDGDVASLEMKLWLASFDTEVVPADKEISALVECWRLGLILYCTRVFHQGENVQEKTYQLAEKIMWLVQEILPYSDKQKQAAVPIFWAACEMRSFCFRQIAIDFCERWKKRSGLWLNQTIIDLIRRVWAAIDGNPDKDIWWGDLVDSNSELCYSFG